jgi:2-polyprenyl-3-methyl-5-hydroxy-6-metoxy-1,4-benzoquinol methylase
MSDHATELTRGERFSFGNNWFKYLQNLDSARIARAVESVQQMVASKNLIGKRFLDVGSGSGLFSLAARQLGAAVLSFDYDPASVECTREVRSRFSGDSANWVVDEGSILDPVFLSKLDTYDVVYSWGVLHHTGSMWRALENAASLVSEQGLLCVALYNDQGTASQRWARIKRTYCGAREPVRTLIVLAALVRLWGPTTIRDLLRGRPGATWREYELHDPRGMSPWRDVVDWVGGYPFEVAKPEDVLVFLKARGFSLERLKTCGGGLGCNEFVFQRRRD